MPFTFSKSQSLAAAKSDRPLHHGEEEVDARSKLWLRHVVVRDQDHWRGLQCLRSLVVEVMHAREIQWLAWRAVVAPARIAGVTLLDDGLALVLHPLPNTGDVAFARELHARPLRQVGLPRQQVLKRRIHLGILAEQTIVLQRHSWGHCFLRRNGEEPVRIAIVQHLAQRQACEHPRIQRVCTIVLHARPLCTTKKLATDEELLGQVRGQVASICRREDWAELAACARGAHGNLGTGCQLLHSERAVSRREERSWRRRCGVHLGGNRTSSCSIASHRSSCILLGERSEDGGPVGGTQRGGTSRI